MEWTNARALKKTRKRKEEYLEFQCGFYGDSQKPCNRGTTSLEMARTIAVEIEISYISAELCLGGITAKKSWANRSA